MPKYIKRIIAIAGISLFVFFSVLGVNLYKEHSADKLRWDKLESDITAQTKGFKGQVYIVVKDYNRGWRISMDADTKVPAASIIKVPIMGAIYAAEQSKRFSASDMIRLKQSDKTGGSGRLKNERSGKEFSIQQLIELMCTISDNTATNILINMLGFDYYNEWFHRQGLENTNLSRLMMDMAARSRGIENYTTADDMALVFDKIYRNRFVNKKVSSESMRILKKQKTRNRIPAKLPKATVVAHKTGLERGICHDAGIVFTENGNFLLCVLTSHNYSNSYRSRELISHISRLVYNYYQSP